MTLVAVYLSLAFLAGEDPPSVEMPAAEVLALTVEPQAIDFGDVARFTCQERIVRIENCTGAPLRLAGTGSDCRCLTSLTGAERLAPHESIEWRIALNVCGDFVGEVRRYVWITSDSPGMTKLRLPVRYRVVPELYFEPSFLALGLVGEGVTQQEVTIKTLSAAPIRLVAAACDHPAAVVELLDDVVRADQPARVRVRVQGPLPEGELHGIVEVDTTSVEMPRLRIPLVGEASGGLSSDCPELVFGPVPWGTAVERSVRLSCGPGLEVGGAYTSNDAVTVSAVRREGSQVLIVLRSGATLPLGEFRGSVMMEVNGGTRRKVRLPYRGRVVEARAAGAPTQAQSLPPQPGCSPGDSP